MAQPGGAIIDLVLIPDVGHRRRLVTGAAEAAAGHPGCSLRLHEHAWSDPAWVGRLRGAATIVHGRLHHPSVGAALAARGKPVINVGDPGSVPGAVDLDLDDRAIGLMAAEHLITSGWTPRLVVGHGALRFSCERQAGFLATVGQEGMLSATASDPLTDLLAGLLPGSGVFAVNDQAAWVVAAACERAGISLGSTLGLVGCGDDEVLCHTAAVPLSSIIPPSEALGRCAMETALTWLAGNRPPGRTLGPLGVRARHSTELSAHCDPLVAAALRHIRECLGRRLRIADLARDLGVAARTLEVRFQTAIGRSPQAELVRQRLERARILLATTDLPVAAVARRCGLASPQRLHDLFHRHHGLTLATWRGRLRPATT